MVFWNMKKNAKIIEVGESEMWAFQQEWFTVFQILLKFNNFSLYIFLGVFPIFRRSHFINFLWGANQNFQRW